MTFADVPPSPAHPLQNMGELRALWEFVAARPHHRVLEIGSLYGGTLWHWSHLPAVELLVSVDVVSEHPSVHDGVLAARQQWDDWFSSRVDFFAICGDSHATSTLEDASAAASPWPFDFAFIDGDHSFEGVRADWLAWSPLVAPGGVVAFHDTWPNYDRHEPGVVAWCDELRHELPSVQWTDPDGVGICAFVLP